MIDYKKSQNRKSLYLLQYLSIHTFVCVYFQYVLFQNRQKEFLKGIKTNLSSIYTLSISIILCSFTKKNTKFDRLLMCVFSSINVFNKAFLYNFFCNLQTI